MNAKEGVSFLGVRFHLQFLSPDCPLPVWPLEPQEDRAELPLDSLRGTSS